jgi:hypothetical protein
MVLCAGGLAAVATQVRCVDSSREAARLAARGDENAAAQAVRRGGPTGAELVLHRDGGFVVARVTARPVPLPGFTVAAASVAAIEPGG